MQFESVRDGYRRRRSHYPGDMGVGRGLRGRLHPREHEGAASGFGHVARHKSIAFARLGDRDKAVIGASVAVLALEFSALQPSRARGIHDSEQIAGAATPSQAESSLDRKAQKQAIRKMARSRMPSRPASSLAYISTGRTGLVGLLDLGNDGLARRHFAPGHPGPRPSAKAALIRSRT